MGMRRVEELAQFEELERELPRRMPRLWWMRGKFGYIISSKWLREWHSFVGLDQQGVKMKPSCRQADRPPLPISNTDLFQLDGSLRAGLGEGLQREYRVLEQPVWDLFAQIYGGGPAILRYNANGSLPVLA